MDTRIHFGDPAQYRLKSAAELARSILEVSARRLLKGPRRASWNWATEVGTQMLRRQIVTAFKMHDVTEARRYLDSFVVSLPVLSEVEVTPVVQGKFRGSWFIGKSAHADLTLLYFHGGGYSFYPQSYASFIALVARAAQARSFALEYRLSPEYRFPAQLDDAFHAYRWLLETVDPGTVILAGDSAGGNLALALLLSLRDLNLPLPALAVLLSPATDMVTEYPSMDANQSFDWITKPSVLQWGKWFCDSTQLDNPQVSPVRANLRGLPPIYVQAGAAEILYDSIAAFADAARRQGVEVVLEAWEDMNHVFQLFGQDAPQSAEALRRIGEVIDLRVRKRRKMGAVSAASLQLR